MRACVCVCVCVCVLRYACYDVCVFYRNTTLNILNTIQEIRGTLHIENWSYETFPYLSNLHILGSNQTSQLQSLPSQCNNGSRVPYALYVANNPNLISIDLSSLREIRAGGFHLHNNPQLCLLGDLSSLVTNTSAPVCATTQARRNTQQCGEYTHMHVPNIYTPTHTH